MFQSNEVGFEQGGEEEGGAREQPLNPRVRAAKGASLLVADGDERHNAK